MDARRLQRELQAERIGGRKDLIRYVELKTSINWAHVKHIEDELAPIMDDLMRHEMRGAGRTEPMLNPVVSESERCG